jgi:hypothetical protein
MARGRRVGWSAQDARRVHALCSVVIPRGHLNVWKFYTGAALLAGARRDFRAVADKIEVSQIFSTILLCVPAGAGDYQSCMFARIALGNGAELRCVVLVWVVHDYLSPLSARRTGI